MRNGLVRVSVGDGNALYRVEFFLQDGEQWPSSPVASATVSVTLDDHSGPEATLGGGAVEMTLAHVRGNGQTFDFRKTGEFLHSLLFQGDVEQRWREAAEGPLRTYLLIKPAELRSVPWEMMKYPNGSTLFTSQDRPFTRVDQFPSRARQEDASPLLPIRIMVVEGERDSEIGTAKEIRAIKQALSTTNGRLEAEYLKAPTRQELIDAYKRLRPHILHFVGHTTWDTRTNQPALRLRNLGVRDDETVTPDVLRLLQPAPRVAVLNACRSAATDSFHMLSQCFFSDEPGMLGAAAVIGMQGDVKGSAAARFGGELYRVLARGATVDIAVAAARSEVYSNGGATENEHDWFLPVLTICGDAERALHHRTVLSSRDQTTMELKLSGLVGEFVDRSLERSRIIENLAPRQADPARLVVVHGEKGSGKSQFLHWLRRWCALRGQRVKYVDLKGEKTLDYAGVLDAIRITDEDVTSFVPGVTASGNGTGTRHTADPVGRNQGESHGDVRSSRFLDPSSGMEDGALPDGVVAQFNSFSEDLMAMVARKPLVLILDHVDGVVPTDFKGYVHPLLIERVVRGEIPDLTVIVSLDHTQSVTHWAAPQNRTAPQWIDLELLDREDFAGKHSPGVRRVSVRASG